MFKKQRLNVQFFNKSIPVKSCLTATSVASKISYKCLSNIYTRRNKFQR